VSDLQIFETLLLIQPVRHVLIKVTKFTARLWFDSRTNLVGVLIEHWFLRRVYLRLNCDSLSRTIIAVEKQKVINIMNLSVVFSYLSGIQVVFFSAPYHYVVCGVSGCTTVFRIIS